MPIDVFSFAFIGQRPFQLRQHAYFWMTSGWRQRVPSSASRLERGHETVGAQQRLVRKSR